MNDKKHVFLQNKSWVVGLSSTPRACARGDSRGMVPLVRAREKAGGRAVARARAGRREVAATGGRVADEVWVGGG